MYNTTEILTNTTSVILNSDESSEQDSEEDSELLFKIIWDILKYLSDNTVEVIILLIGYAIFYIICKTSFVRLTICCCCRLCARILCRCRCRSNAIDPESRVQSNSNIEMTSRTRNQLGVSEYAVCRCRCRFNAIDVDPELQVQSNSNIEVTNRMRNQLGIDSVASEAIEVQPIPEIHNKSNVQRNHRISTV